MRCPYCVTGDRYVLIADDSGRVAAVHGERIAPAVLLIAAICDEWGRFVGANPKGTGR